MPADTPSLDTIFCAAIAIAAAADRAAYIARACGDDTELRGRVHKLVQAHLRAGRPPQQPAPNAVESESIAFPFPEPPVAGALEERPGKVIGSYKLLEQIGEGGFGVVFLAEQQQPVRRKVALKVLKPGMDTRRVVARFEAERQALALMDHPNIARVFDGGTAATGRPYFVMELVRGVPLTAYCDQHQLTIKERLGLFLSVCQAVQHAHQKGIIHRDLKPSNILVAVHEGTPAVKVIDFGVAKALGQQLTDKTLYTGFAQLVGTPLYMSPEQAALGSLDVDTRSDIYSLGVVLYELLTGATPFDRKRFLAAGYDEVRRILREEEPPRPSTRISTLGEAAAAVSAQRKSDPRRLRQFFRGELDWIVMKALEKDRGRRYETAGAFAADVERYLRDEPVLACPPSAAYRLRKWLRKHRAAAVTGAALALLLVLLSLGLAGNNLMIRREQARTQAANERLRDNLELSLKTLDEIYLQMLEVRLPRDPNAAQENEELLNKALGFYENFAERNEGDPNVRREVAKAYGRAGILHLRLGHQEKGKAALDRAAQVCARLIEDFPADPEPNRLLAEVHLYKGEAYLARGELVTEDFQKGIELLEPLLATGGLRPECLGTLSVLHNDLGLCLQRSGDLEEAGRHYREAIELQAKVVGQTDDLPRKLSAALQLAGMRSNLGYWLIDAHRLEDAAQEERGVITLVNQLHAQASTLPGYQRGRLAGFPSWQTVPAQLAEAHLMLARALRGMGQSRAAEESFNRSLEFWTQAVKDWPAEPRHRWKLAILELDMGSLLFEGGRRPEALKHYRHCIDLVQALDKESPGARDNQELLGECLAGMGDLFLAEGDREKAAEHYHRALAIKEEVVARNPDNASVANDLAWFLAVCADPGFRDPARAASLALKVVQQVPENGDFWNTLGVAQYRQGQWMEAVVSLEKANRIHQERDEGTWWFLAMAHWHLRQKEAARTCYDRADELAKGYEYPRAEEGRFRAEAAQLHIRGDSQ
jgi:serine/threonine protein kinase/Flp pilus assembly protein TadD